ncbi:hypothetical protein BHE90_004942 [Fusarium euwallaceae]|uniref:DUF4387 domain-containing protein n=3 Tax=Fusarium solani species complex TaxID=232080 RepID=A0A3M2S6C2_9HYPO|nr:hypothetical protein CDV36_007207 [Fusarium kuroshium]RSL76866.1 hypothetical protein CEP51_009580 [Fusarium floridanum]RTE80545.1 hypothetical protein BHE90_004942 [Fusarium euwallaceae]
MTGADFTAKPLCQIVTPVGMMGYGFSEEQVEAALDDFSHFPTPTAIILDSGSTDSGPSKLALGTTTCPRSSYVRDFRKLLRFSKKYQVPLLMSSAGGDGSDEHVDFFLEIVREIAREPEHSDWKLKVLAIYSEVPKTVVLDKLASGKIQGCGESVPVLTPEMVNATPRIVAQMGPEPLLDAIKAHPDYNVLIAGRAYDLAPYVAFTAQNALSVRNLTSYTDLSPQELGCVSHLGKILECGGLCATPKGPGALGIMNQDLSFDIRPLDPRSRCTPLSVAAHTLYEKTRPDKLVGPGGYIDLANSIFDQLEDGRTVRVRGSVFHACRHEGTTYTVKLEGAQVAGYRTLTMGSFKDPILIPQVHSFLDSVKAFASSQHSHISEKWDIGFHVYGFDEHRSDYVPSEVFIVAECIAESQEVATSLASTVRVHCVHGSYPNQKATSGNFAMGIGGMFELETKQCAEFSVYHLMPLSEGQEGSRPALTSQMDADGQRGLFRWREYSIGNGSTYNKIRGAVIATDAAPSQQRQNPVNISKAMTNGTAAVHKQPRPFFEGRPKTLVDVAKVIRSKNSGPYEITLDVMFDNMDVYQTIKASGLLDSGCISRLFSVPEDQVIWAGFFDVAMAFKATVPRRRRGSPACSGGYLENDVHGSQQYIPLVKLALPEDLQQKLMVLSQ